MKRYTVHMSSGPDYIVDEVVKENIFTAKSNFLLLKNGDVINRSFIVSIKEISNITPGYRLA
jgi:hypothetical protein